MLLIAECISNESDVVMHLIVWYEQANLAECVNYHLVWYRQCKCHGSDIRSTAKVQHEHITNAWSINHYPTSNITMVAMNKATSAIGILYSIL